MPLDLRNILCPRDYVHCITRVPCFEIDVFVRWRSHRERCIRILDPKEKSIGKDAVKSGLHSEIKRISQWIDQYNMLEKYTVWGISGEMAINTKTYKLAIRDTD